MVGRKRGEEEINGGVRGEKGGELNRREIWKGEKWREEEEGNEKRKGGTAR